MTESPVGSVRFRATFWMTAIALLLPPVVDLFMNGFARAGHFLASDAYYYLTIGRNAIDLGYFTFDREYPTNGFHPLWQGLLAVLFGAARVVGIDRVPMLTVVLLFQLLVTSAAYLWLADSIHRLRHRLTPLFPLVLIGCVGLITIPFRRNVGSAWSYVNGMESPLLLLSFAWVVRELLRPERDRSTQDYLRLGLALTAVFLSRLDHAFLVVTVLGWIAFEFVAVPERGRRWTRLWPAFLVPVLALGLFLVTNRVFFDTWMPVSGAAKSSFPIPSLDNWRYLYSLVEDPDQPLRQRRLWRGIQLFFPSAVAVFCLMRQFFRRPTTPADARWARCMAILSVFTLILSSYDFFFVPLIAHGHWYVPATVVFASIYLLDLLDGRLPVRLDTRWLAGLSAAVAVVFYIGVFAQGKVHQRYEVFLEHGPGEIQAASLAPSKIVEYDDGIISYVAGWPALSGFGFAIDSDGLEAFRNATLLDLAYERGYRHFASVGYFKLGGLNPGSTSSEIGKVLHSTFHFPQELVDGWHFEVVAVLPRSSLVLVAFSPLSYGDSQASTAPTRPHAFVRQGESGCNMNETSSQKSGSSKKSDSAGSHRNE